MPLPPLSQVAAASDAAGRKARRLKALERLRRLSSKVTLSGLYNRLECLDEDELRARLLGEWGTLGIVGGLVGGLSFQPYISPSQVLGDVGSSPPAGGGRGRRH